MPRSLTHTLWLISAVAFLFAIRVNAQTTPEAGVDVPSLVGKVVKPKFDIGLDEAVKPGATSRPIITDILPLSGRVQYRTADSLTQLIEHHTNFPAGTEFKVIRAKVFGRTISLHVAPLGTGPERIVRLWLFPGWQQNPRDPKTGLDTMNDYALTNLFSLYLNVGLSEQAVAELRGSPRPSPSSEVTSENSNLAAGLQRALVGAHVTTVDRLGISATINAFADFYTVGNFLSLDGNITPKVFKDGKMVDIVFENWWNGHDYTIDRIQFWPKFLEIDLSVPLDPRQANAAAKHLAEKDGKIHVVIEMNLGEGWQSRCTVNDILGVLNTRASNPAWPTITENRLKILQAPFDAERDAQTARLAQQQAQEKAATDEAEQRKKAFEASERDAETKRILGTKRDLTIFPTWIVEAPDPSNPSITPSIRSKTAITGIKGASAEIRLSCEPDEATDDLRETHVVVNINLQAATIDQTHYPHDGISVDKIPYSFRLYTMQDDNAWSTNIEVQNKIENGKDCGGIVYHCYQLYKYLPDEKHLSYWISAPDLDSTRSFYSNMLSINYGMIELRMNRSSPAFNNFVSSCNKLTPKQERLRRMRTNK